MVQSPAAGGGPGPSNADTTRQIEPSILTALPHYLSLAVFPLILVAALYGVGGWCRRLPL